MREADVWKSVSDTEFDNALEGMEKLVMNRLYDLYGLFAHSQPCFLINFCFSTFTPQIAHSNPPRPITTDDLERDRVLTQRIALFGWIQPAHLDVPVAEGANGFLLFAQQGYFAFGSFYGPS
jgi:Rab5 GDP/GTP exchange factor